MVNKLLRLNKSGSGWNKRWPDPKHSCTK